MGLAQAPVMSMVRDMSLAESGLRKIAWVEARMPAVARIEEELKRKRPFAGKRFAVSIHMEAKTARLVKAVMAGGGEVAASGCNPLSTQDDVAAALASLGATVNAWHGETPDEYEEHLRRTLSIRPNIVLDDGGDLATILHTTMREALPEVVGGCEETTTGLNRLRALAREGNLMYPVIAINDADCKHLFDNRYGTGQSVWDGINRTTNLVVAGKTVVVAGYGWCGKGIALRAKGFGAKVIVTEIDPVKAAEAWMDGCEVMRMEDAAAVGDIFITATGCSAVIGAKCFARMKDGAIMCNAGHFDVEIDIPALEAASAESFEQRLNIVGYRTNDGRTLNLLAQGRLVNLASGDGHPAEIMDMSFSLQLLGARYLLDARLSGAALPNAVTPLPRELDLTVARYKLESLGVLIDAPTPEQEAYMNDWNPHAHTD